MNENKFHTERSRSVPKGWEMKKLGEVAVIARGKSKHRPRDASFLFSGKYPFIQTGDIRKADLYLTEYTQTYSEEGLKQSKLWDENTLCITIAANIAETAILKIKACFPDSVIGLIPYNDKADTLYIKYCFDKYKTQIQNISEGAAQDNLNQEKLSKIQFLFPPLPEQQKIATLLSTWDEAIHSTEKLLAQKELRKKWLMQKLFGNEKLKMKNEKWEEVRLGEIVAITTGKLDANAMVKNGKYRFYTCAKEYFQIDDFAFDTEALLISGNGAHVGYIHYYKGKFNAYQRTYVLDQFTQNIMYIKYFLDEHLSKRINSEKKEGNTPYIVLSTLSEMVIQIPSLSEQTRIATILQTADKEISLLKSKVAKLKEQKKGLMQVLLTGKKRLINNIETK